MGKRPYVERISPIEDSSPNCFHVEISDGPVFWKYRIGFDIEFPHEGTVHVDAPSVIEGYHIYAHPVIALVSNPCAIPTFPVVCSPRNYIFHYAGAYSMAFVIMAPVMLAANWASIASGEGFALEALLPFLSLWALSTAACLAGRFHQSKFNEKLGRDIRSALDSALMKKAACK